MDADAVFFGDLDEAPSIQVRVDELRHRYHVPAHFPIVVVCRVIEGWYLAGLPDFCNRRMWAGDKVIDVNHIDKASFNRGQPRRFQSRVEWMIELLEAHVRPIAIGRSQSFALACRLLDTPGCT